MNSFNRVKKSYDLSYGRSDVMFSKNNWCLVLLQGPANSQIVHNEIINRTIVIRYKAGKTSIILSSSMYRLKYFASHPEISFVSGVEFLQKMVLSAFFSLSHFFFWVYVSCI